MKLWLIERTADHGGEWDIFLGFVVRAETEQAARQLAAENSVGWHPTPDADWLDSAWASCVEVSAEGDAGVILDSFKAG